MSQIVFNVGRGPNGWQRNAALHVAWLLSATQIASSWVVAADSPTVYVLKLWTITTFTFSQNSKKSLHGDPLDLQLLKTLWASRAGLSW